MQTDECYIYVQGWASNHEFNDRAQAAADPALRRKCVVLADATGWPAGVPTPSAGDCAIVICGCPGSASRSLDAGSNNFAIRKAFTDAEASCA